jgi:peroxiredoxin
VRVLAISVDDRAHALQLWRDVLSRNFTVLSDPAAKVIRKYGLLHAHGAQGHDIALDTALFIDERGIERFRQVSQTLPDLPTAPEILDQIREAESQKDSTSH